MEQTGQRRRKNLADPSAEQEVLAKLVEDYNATGNPGK
jgi:hypothetical protein